MSSLPTSTPETCRVVPAAEGERFNSGPDRPGAIGSREKAGDYATRRYVHYHELVSADDGPLHPTKVLWRKHAWTTFTLDGGPHSELSQQVTPGIDAEFIPNAATPYPS